MGCGHAGLGRAGTLTMAEPTPDDLLPQRIGTLCPTVVGYGYAVDAGLVRTPMHTGATRQRRRWFNARHEITLRFILTVEGLAFAESFLDAVDYGWFTIGIITSAHEDGNVVVHSVRPTADPVVRAITGAHRYEFLLPVESFDPIILVEGSVPVEPEPAP